MKNIRFTRYIKNYTALGASFLCGINIRQFGEPARLDYLQSLSPSFLDFGSRADIDSQLIHSLLSIKFSIDTMEHNANNSTINLDRALPALPLALCLDLPPNISFKPPPQTESPHERPTSSTNSPTSPTTSRGRLQFRSITRELLRPSDSPLPSPTSTWGQSHLLDPVKYNLSDNSTQKPQMLSGYVLVFQS